MKKPEALRLADELDAIPETGADPDLIQEAAAELRRLHTEKEALLEALKKMRVKYGEYACRVCDQADAAIKAVEGEKK